MDPTNNVQLTAEGQGVRVESRNIINYNGSVQRVINIGLPKDHPYADLESRAGSS